MTEAERRSHSVQRRESPWLPSAITVSGTFTSACTFGIRLELEAVDRHEAKLDEATLGSAALREAGSAEADALLAPPAVTGIDCDLWQPSPADEGGNA